LSLFLLGDFKLHSGELSEYLIDANALDGDALLAVAHRLAVIVGPYGYVEGIPRGGLRLALAMQQYRTLGHPAILLVDDVWTTGQSMREKREEMKAEVGGGPVFGAVIFHRGQGILPYWCVAFSTVNV
jgi:orotate phosphoribosyltransferase